MACPVESTYLLLSQVLFEIYQLLIEIIKLTTRISTGKSANPYRLPSCGWYAVVNEIAFILPIKN